MIIFSLAKNQDAPWFFLWPKCMLSISYWEADQTCRNTQGQLRFNDPMRVHPIQRMIYRAPLEFVEKKYLSVH